MFNLIEYVDGFDFGTLITDPNDESYKNPDSAVTYTFNIGVNYEDAFFNEKALEEIKRNLLEVCNPVKEKIIWRIKPFTQINEHGVICFRCRLSYEGPALDRDVFFDKLTEKIEYLKQVKVV